MHMVWHNAYCMYNTTLPVAMQQCFHNKLGNSTFHQQTFAISRIKIPFNVVRIKIFQFPQFIF